MQSKCFSNRDENGEPPVSTLRILVLLLILVFITHSSAIDNDSALDDEMEELVHDAEDIYFDSESPSAAPPYDYSDLEHNTDSTGDCTLTY